MKAKPNIMSSEEHKQDVKPNIEFNKESEPDMNKITYEEEKVAFICNMCSDSIQTLSDYEWDDHGIIGVYKLM